MSSERMLPHAEVEAKQAQLKDELAAVAEQLYPRLIAGEHIEATDPLIVDYAADFALSFQGCMTGVYPGGYQFKENVWIALIGVRDAIDRRYREEHHDCYTCSCRSRRDWIKRIRSLANGRAAREVAALIRAKCRRAT
jgi:hypothetical protein